MLMLKRQRLCFFRREASGGDGAGGGEGFSKRARGGTILTPSSLDLGRIFQDVE